MYHIVNQLRSLDNYCIYFILVYSNDTEYEYLEEYPIKLLHLLPDVTGRVATGRVFVISLEYGQEFSGQCIFLL